MEKYCTKCGTKYPKEIKFCTKCGIELKEIPKPQPVQPAPPPVHKKPVKEPKIPKGPKQVGKIVLPAVIIAIILSIVALILPMIMGTSALSTGSVGSNELANNAVTGAKINDGTITDDDIETFGISRIALASISGDHIISNAIDFKHLNSDVSDAITGAVSIANNSITGAMIQNGTIDTVDIKDNAVTSAKIPNDAVGVLEIASGAVGTDEIANGAINSVDIADNAVTYAKMDIKIRYGLAASAVNGTTVSHFLGSAPSAVIVTPVYGNDNYILHANVHSANANTFTLALWKETIPGGVPSEVTSNISVYWIAIA